MATQINIGNRTTSVPGVYGIIRSGIINPPSAVDFGNVVIIDDGSLKVPSYIAINGIDGENRQGLDSALEFTQFAETVPYIWDSELLPIVKSLFRPSNRQGAAGINKLTIIQASETTAASAEINFTNLSAPLELKTQFEGESLNGTLVAKNGTEFELGSGVACRLEKGRSFGYSLVFYRGVHTRAEDELNPGYGYNEKLLPDVSKGVPAGEFNIVKPRPLFRSPDLRRLSELKRWMDKSADFKRWFKIEQFIVDPSSDLIVANDITNNYTASSPYTLFTGATTTFTQDAFMKAVDASRGLDNSFYLALGYGKDSTNSNNTAIYELITSGQLNWDKFMFVGAYPDQDTFLGETGSSESTARYYNSSKVVAVHGAARVSNTEYADGYRNISVLEKAAKILGRTAGLSPQTPVTWKDINISSEVHKLSEGDKEAAMSNGILCTYYDTELSNFIVLGGINTLGDNDFLIVGDEDTPAESYSIQIMRIISQLNKELIFGAKRAFFGNNTGPNRNTASAEDVMVWTKGFLNARVATNEKDNLIVRVGKISAHIEEDNIFVNYEFVPNSEISKILFVGVIISE